MSGLFEHLAAFDDSERVAARKAAAVANKRVKDQVGDFLANATSPKDFESRLSLVDDDIKTAVADVVAEYGGDAERVEAAVRRSIAADDCEDYADEDKDFEDDNNYRSCKHCKGKGCLKCKEAKSCNCWDGYERVPGTEPCSPGSCRKCDDHRKSSDQSNDYDRADEGASTDFTVDNLCPECGDGLDDDYVEADGTPYGRPDRTVALHAACARAIRRNSSDIDEQLAEAPSAVGNTSLENGEVEEKPNFLASAALADGNEHQFDESGHCINCGEHRIRTERSGLPCQPLNLYPPSSNPRHDVDTNAGWSGEPNNGNYPRMATQFRPRGDDRNPYGEGNTDDYQDSGRDDPAESWGENVDSSGHRVVPMRPEHARHLEMCYPDDEVAQGGASNKNFAVLDPAGVPVAAFNDNGNSSAAMNKPLPLSPATQFDQSPVDSDFPISPRQPIDLHRGSIDRNAADAPEGSGGAVKREKLPKGNADATGAPSPKIDKGKAGDEKGHKKRDIDTEYDNSPVPEWRDKQDVTTGRGDAEKGTSDYTHSSPELTSDTLTQEDLPTGNEDAQSTERNIEQNKTETFPNKGQANPVTSQWQHNYEVVPATKEHADKLQNSAGYNYDNPDDAIDSTWTVLKNGKPHSMFNENEQHVRSPEGQDVVDRAVPHVYPDSDVDPNSVRRYEASVSKRIDALMKRATENPKKLPNDVDPCDYCGKEIVNGDGRYIDGGKIDARVCSECEAKHKASSVDPDKNPIQEILNDFNQDQSAIAEFERKAMTDPSCNCNGNCNGTCQR